MQLLDRVVWPAAILGPVLVAAALVPLRDTVDTTNDALILVVVVVAVAAAGRSRAGLAAALVASMSYEFFLTTPYESLKIDNVADVQTTVLLLVVGFAVAELAVWGRRHHAAAVRLAGYSEGVQAAVAAVDDDAPLETLLDQVCDQLATVLQLPRCRFDQGTGVLGGDHPRLRTDGQVEVNGVDCDVDRLGLPVDRDLEILLTSGGRYLGRFVLTSRSGARPTLQQRLAAVTLAHRASSALASRSTASGE